MKTLLPPNATALERGFEQACAVPPLPVPVRDLWSPDRCPLHLLPWLAWALSVDLWEDRWPEGVKREKLRQAIAIQRHKGSVAAIEAAVATFGGHVMVREWWEDDPQGPPHTFRLLLSLNQAGAPADAAYVDAVIAEIHRVKPVRSHFTFEQSLAAAASLNLIGGARAITSARMDHRDQPV